jgi:hypothetical protein
MTGTLSAPRPQMAALSPGTRAHTALILTIQRELHCRFAFCICRSPASSLMALAQHRPLQLLRCWLPPTAAPPPGDTAISICIGISIGHRPPSYSKRSTCHSRAGSWVVVVAPARRPAAALAASDCQLPARGFSTDHGPRPRTTAIWISSGSYIKKGRRRKIRKHTGRALRKQ